jgi:hypothetical protein
MRSILTPPFPPDLRFSSPWRTYLTGEAALEVEGDTLRLVTTDTRAGRYTDAQLDDYQGLERGHFLWRPPLRMNVRACFSHPAGVLRGTAGFGFWNDPFMMTGRRWPALPRALWFFYSSPPSNMQLAQGVPGPGWKAATLDATGWPFFALLPTAPLAVPLMNVGPLYRLCWPIGQRAIQVSEALVPAEMTTWHTYLIEWHPKAAHFSVDGERILAGAPAPRGPLGFVLWLDNQYMVVTPWGKFGYGLLDAPGRQWLEVAEVTIENI